MLVVSVQGNFEKAKEEIFSASKMGEAIEFRLDLMEKNDLPHISKLKDLCTLPVIFTLRKKSHGGSFEGNERKREEKLLNLLTLNPDYVDLEYDSCFADKIDPAIKMIVSYHNLDETPRNLEKILKKMEHIPAAIYKIATMANSSLDALRMLLFVKCRENIAAMCMGRHGAITRILAPVVGSALTYCFIGDAAALGQLSLSELTTVYHYYRLNRSTKIYGLIGDPVDNSIGHLFHNQIFRKVEENAVYVKMALTPSEVPDFFTLIQDLPFFGLSVTMPLKEVIDPQRAINTLINRKGEWLRMNTDGSGALDALEKKGKVAGRTLLIIGAGGVAKAIATEASRRGARVIIANRTFKKAKRIASQIKGKVVPIDRIDSCHYDIIINTTAVGMSPKIGEMAISEELVKEKVLGFDVVIDPKETKFLNCIQNKGGKIVFGYEMYVCQAFRQLKAWSII